MIVLAILKWIGIVLLGMAGLVLVLFALVLFVPVRYMVMAESAGEGVSYGFRFSFLYPLVYLRKAVEEEGASVCILGIPLFSFFDGKETERQRTEEPGVPPDHPGPSGEKGTEPHRDSGQKSPDKRPKREKRAKSKSGKNRFSFGDISSIIKVIRDAEFRHAFGTVRKELWALVRVLSPGRVEGDIRIGTGDPASTGLLVGGVSLMPFAYQKGIHIVPDFEEKIFRGNAKIKGRIRVFYFVRLVIRVYRDEELRRVWNRLNRKK